MQCIFFGISFIFYVFFIVIPTEYMICRIEFRHVPPGGYLCFQLRGVWEDCLQFLGHLTVNSPVTVFAIVKDIGKWKERVSCEETHNKVASTTPPHTKSNESFEMLFLFYQNQVSQCTGKAKNNHVKLSPSPYKINI